MSNQWDFGKGNTAYAMMVAQQRGLDPLAFSRAVQQQPWFQSASTSGEDVSAQIDAMASTFQSGVPSTPPELQQSQQQSDTRGLQPPPPPIPPQPPVPAQNPMGSGPPNTGGGGLGGLAAFKQGLAGFGYVPGQNPLGMGPRDMPVPQQNPLGMGPPDTAGGGVTPPAAPPVVPPATTPPEVPPTTPPVVPPATPGADPLTSGIANPGIAAILGSNPNGAPPASIMNPAVTNLTAMGTTGSAFGKTPFADMSNADQQFFYPFHVPEVGGPSQAAYNIAQDLGFKPAAGDPWTNFNLARINPLAQQADIMQALQGTAPSQMDPAIAAQVSAGMRAGAGSLTGNSPKDIIGQLVALGKQSMDTASPSARDLQTRLMNPTDAQNVMSALTVGAGPAYYRNATNGVLQDMAHRYYQQLPASPGMSPFEFYARQLGYVQ